MRIFETIADIAFIAGYNHYFSGNSREDIRDFIIWAKEFEAINENTDWEKVDYITLIYNFTIDKLGKIT